MLQVAFPLLLIFVTTASGQTKPPLSTTTAPQPQQTATAKIKVVFNAAPSVSFWSFYLKKDDFQSSNSAAPSLTVNSAPLGTTVQSNVMAAPPIQLQAVPAISVGLAMISALCSFFQFIILWSNTQEPLFHYPVSKLSGTSKKSYLPWKDTWKLVKIARG